MHIIYTPGTMLYDIEIQGTEEELRLVHAALVEARKTISLGIGSGRPDPQSNPVIRTDLLPVN